MSTPLVLFVDDSDTERILYTDDTSHWIANGTFREHNSTTHGLSAGTGSFKFAFNGTSAALYGTVPADGMATGNCTVKDQSSQFHLDQKEPSTMYNFQYCVFPKLPGDQEHTLVVSVDASASDFFLDYILYQFPSEPNPPLNAVPPGSAANVVIDDSQIDRILYNPPSQDWKIGGSDKEYNSSTHGISQNNAATATLEFAGTAVQVYGTVGLDTLYLQEMTSAYTIDDGLPTKQRQYQLPHEVSTQLLFFSASGLQDTIHTLHINSILSNKHHEYWLDFIVYTASSSFGISTNDPDSPPPAATPSKLSRPPLAPSASTSTKVSTSSSSPAPTTSVGNNTSDASQASSRASGIHTPLIVGVTIAAIVVILAMIMALLMIYRKRVFREPSTIERWRAAISNRFMSESATVVDPGPPDIKVNRYGYEESLKKKRRKSSQSSTTDCSSLDYPSSSYYITDSA